jgi:protein-arginine kinase activator protein McsA
MTGSLGMIHGRLQHTGRTSAGYRARAEKAERLVKLRKQLKDAVASEQYESAAALRDKIRGLETEL